MAEITTEIDLTRQPKNTGQDDQVVTNQNVDKDDLDIEVLDDTPEADRNRAARAPGTKSSIPEDEEIGQYTKGVQDRLRQMKWEYHEERRAKETWQREQQAALDIAKKVYAENVKLRKLVTDGHKTLIDTSKSAAEGEMSAIQESLKAAMETGNTGLAAELQGKLAKAAARAEAQNHIAPISFPEEPAQERQEQQQPQQRQQAQVTETMRSWMDDNPWFNKDKRMTALAFGVHEELFEKGVPLESPKYFQEINKAMREQFPNYFGDEQEENNGRSNGNTNSSNGRSPAPRRTAVAGVTRTAGGRQNNKVTLTSSEMAVAKKMGITPEQYAREKIRLENADG